jgi:hypothetical protein
MVLILEVVVVVAVGAHPELLVVVVQAAQVEVVAQLEVEVHQELLVHLDSMVHSLEVVVQAARVVVVVRLAHLGLQELLVHLVHRELLDLMELILVVVVQVV